MGAKTVAGVMQTEPIFNVVGIKPWPSLALSPA